MLISEIHPTDHKSITARNFPDKGFHEADSEFVESEKDNKRVEAEFSRVYELNKRQDSMHNVYGWLAGIGRLCRRRDCSELTRELLLCHTSAASLPLASSCSIQKVLAVLKAAEASDIIEA